MFVIEYWYDHTFIGEQTGTITFPTEKEARGWADQLWADPLTEGAWVKLNGERIL
jgi:hypothetical protein